MTLQDALSEISKATSIEKKKITNHKLANELLAGVPPRKGWEQYYKL